MNNIKRDNQNKRNAPTTLTNQVKKSVSNAGEKLKGASNSLSNAAKGASNAIKEKSEDIQKKIGNAADKSELKAPLSKFATMTQDFLTANTAISKFVSFVLCLLLFIILFQIGAGFLQYFFGPQYNPYIINGMVPSNIQTVISANPNVKEAVPIYRSVDAPQGIEYSWNVWFIVNDNKSQQNSSTLNTTIAPGGQLIFSKGTRPLTNINNNIQQDYVGVSPGLFLMPNIDNASTNTSKSNNLVLVMNTYDGSSNDTTYMEKIIIPNIPMQKWVCCTIRVQGTYVDVYINGVLTQRKILMNIPKQNYYDTYIGQSNGFNGYISSLRYYAKAINFEEIQSLFSAGPSLKMMASSTMPYSSDFLSMNWYYKYNNIPVPT